MNEESCIQESYESKLADILHLFEESPTAYHAAWQAEQHIEKISEVAGIQLHAVTDVLGFKASPHSLISLRLGGSFFAMYVPKKFCSYKIWACHSDSPALKLHSVQAEEDAGMALVTSEPYGGISYESFLGRECSLAGALYYKAGSVKVSEKLFDLKRPLFINVPPALHLSRVASLAKVRSEAEYRMLMGLADNVENIKNMGGSSEGAALLASAEAWKPFEEPAMNSARPADERSGGGGLSPEILLSCLAENTGIRKEDILSVDANFYPVEKPRVIGLGESLLAARGLDNLGMSFTGLLGFGDALKEITKQAATKKTETEQPLLVYALFNHEEVGSRSNEGAASALLKDLMEAAFRGAGHDRDVYLAAKFNSLIASADMAHGLHPNYPSLHGKKRRPHLGAGMVIKKTPNLEYVSSAAAEAKMKAIFQQHNIPYSLYAPKPGSRSGSTIGPILASLLGCQTVDIGFAMLSMHSARELAACKDIGYARLAAQAFFGSL